MKQLKSGHETLMKIKIKNFLKVLYLILLSLAAGSFPFFACSPWEKNVTVCPKL